MMSPQSFAEISFGFGKKRKITGEIRPFDLMSSQNVIVFLRIGYATKIIGGYAKSRHIFYDRNNCPRDDVVCYFMVYVAIRHKGTVLFVSL